MAFKTVSSDATFWLVTLVFPKDTPRADIDAAGDRFVETATSITLFTDKPKITLICEAPPDTDHIAELLGSLSADISSEPLPDRDWLQYVHEEFPPIITDRFFIYGSHYTDPPPDNLVALQIDAATAFGSGEHATTAGCLKALEILEQENFKPGTALDLGCGSGILALAMKNLWDIPIMACDIDDEAVTVTRRHAEVNNLSLETFASNGFAASQFEQETYFDLITANILAEPLVRLAPDIKSHTAPNGLVILSGFLENDADRVLDSYQSLNFQKIHTFEQDSWITLVLRSDDSLVK